MRCFAGPSRSPTDDHGIQADPCFARRSVRWRDSTTTAALRWCDKHCDGPYGKNMRSLIARNWAAARRTGRARVALDRAPEGYETRRRRAGHLRAMGADGSRGGDGLDGGPHDRGDRRQRGRGSRRRTRSTRGCSPRISPEAIEWASRIENRRGPRGGADRRRARLAQDRRGRGREPGCCSRRSRRTAREKARAPAEGSTDARGAPACGCPGGW